MVVRVKTNRIFSGKLYAKERPNSCVTDVTKGLEFELRLGYQDLGCDVKQESAGRFFTEVVIQVCVFTLNVPHGRLRLNGSTLYIFSFLSNSITTRS